MLAKLLLTTALGFAFIGLTGAADPDRLVKTCQRSKLKALGTAEACLRAQQIEELRGRAADPAACVGKFVHATAGANQAAARGGAACRWLVHGDGTATDLDTGLMWELKRGARSERSFCPGGATCADPHDVNNWYRHTRLDSRKALPDGSAFTHFVATLNGRIGPGGTAHCFAAHCDWRLPIIEELVALYDPTVPGCGSPGSSCTSIPGASEVAYQSATRSPRANQALHVLLLSPSYATPVFTEAAAESYPARAVRGRAITLAAGRAPLSTPTPIPTPTPFRPTPTPTRSCGPNPGPTSCDVIGATATSSADLG